MKGMARDDLDVFRQIFFEGSNLNLFTRSLTSDNGALFSRCIDVSAKGVESHHETYKVQIGLRSDRLPPLQRYTE